MLVISPFPSETLASDGYGCPMIVAFSISPSSGDETGGVSEAVADAVRVVRESGLPNETNAMFTNIEGEWDEVMAVVKRAVDAVAAVSPRVGAGAQGRHPRPGTTASSPPRWSGSSASSRADVRDRSGLRAAVPARRPATAPRPDRPARHPVTGGAATAVGWCIAVLAAAAVVAVAVLRPRCVPQARDEPADRTLRRVRVLEGLGNEHTTDPVEYSAVPPAGGAHDPAWLECGAYDAPVRDENAVHDLEHGTVWITYARPCPAPTWPPWRASCPTTACCRRTKACPARSSVTVWDRQLRLAGAGDPGCRCSSRRSVTGTPRPKPLASCARRA